MGDWLGTGRIADQQKVFLPFNEARAYVRKLDLKNYEDWRNYAKSIKRRQEIPAAPWDVYQETGWVSMGDWLGTGMISPQLMVFLPFNEARAFTQGLKLASLTEWKSYCASGAKPDEVPAHPEL
jgi:hypothetical protein